MDKTSLELRAQQLRDREEKKLSRRQHLITLERASKGDLHTTTDTPGYINSASVIDTTILNYLIFIEALDDSHLEAAATYSIWQLAFERPFFAEPRKLYLIENTGSVTAGSNDEASYRKLIRKLSQDHQALIEHAITTDLPKTYRDKVYDTRHLYLAAFEKLITNIAATNQEIEEAEQKELAPIYEP